MAEVLAPTVTGWDVAQHSLFTSHSCLFVLPPPIKGDGAKMVVVRFDTKPAEAIL